MAADDARSFLGYGTRALDVDGDLHASRDWFEAAHRAAEASGDAEVMALAAIGLGGLWVNEQRTAATSGLLRARLRHAATLVDPAGPLALRIRARLAAKLDHRTGGYAAVLAVLDEARASNDPIVRAEALSLAHHRLLGPDHGEQRQQLADELVVEAGRGARQRDLLMGLLCQTVDLFLAGDGHALRRLGELHAELGRGEHLAIGYAARSIDVMLAIRAGRLEKAEQLAQECYECGVKAGDVDAAAGHGAHLVAIRWYQGRLDELVPMLAEQVDAPTLSTMDHSFLAAYAVALAVAGERQRATAALAALRGRSLAALPRSGTWLVTMYGIVEAAYLLGNRHAAERAYELLNPYADQPMLTSHAIACFGSTHHALGVAALTAGDLDRAVSHLREAVHRNLALGHWPAVLHSRLRYAEALARRRDPQDEVLLRGQYAGADEVTGIIDNSIAWSAARTATCVRNGRAWRIEFGARAVVVPHSVGLLHLAVLMANPGAEIRALDLVAGLGALDPPPAVTSAQPVLDRTAVHRYRKHLEDLGELIDDLQSRGDDEAAARARSERDQILAELSAGTRLGGRARTFADEGERARLAVGRAIRRALRHIEQADALIGAHLRAAVHTGVRCWYRP